MGADIVTVSADTKFVHKAWQEHEKELAGVKYRMGADPTGRVARLFGVYDEDAGLALRGTFMINPEGGVLLNAEINFYNLGRNIEELMRTSEVCLSKWKDEGDPTLTPSPEMVGKVHEALGGGA
jgi:NADH-dependent peroxiredoxin subunit C